MSYLINLTKLCTSAVFAALLVGCAMSFPSGKDGTSSTNMPNEQTANTKVEPAPKPQEPKKPSFSELLGACEAGDKLACVNVAEGYASSGEGIRAISILDGLCKDGEESACARLGQLYENGTGIASSPKKAIEIYRDSCNRGGADACYLLANVYRKGEYIKQDYELALQAYRSSCESGNIRACANIGAMYELGLGVPKDLQRAYNIYKVACNNGLETVCTHLKELESSMR